MLTDDEARELLSQVAQHDEAAFRRLYVSLSPPVRHKAWTMLKNDEDAAEVVEGTFLAVWHQAGEFEARDGSTVKTWVVGIGKNQSLMLLRKRKRHEGHEDIEELPALQLDDCVIPGGENWLRADALKRCANKLDPQLRRILELRSIEGLTNNEVGEVLGRPEGSIKRLYHDACKLMRRCLAQGGFGNPLTA